MSKETSGVGQGALPPKDDQNLRGQVVGGQQYVFSHQSPGMTIKQVTPGSISGSPNLPQRTVTRIISLSPSRSGQTSPLRPSLANQSIVNALTQSRTNTNIRLQLFTSSNDGNSSNTQGSSSRPLKRPLSATSMDKKDAYASKRQRVINHRIVRSKLIKEKYNEHLLETFYLENDNNILDLYQFAKKPKTQVHLTYLTEHAIDPNDFQDETPTVVVPQTTPSTPSATPLNSLPGISSSQTIPSNSSTPSITDNNYTSTPKSTPKVKTPNQTTNNQEMIVEKAKQEAYVVQRIADLQKEGLWSEKRLPKVQEMSRSKAHWDFLLEEMVWLAADFAQERKWKKAAAKKCARMVQKYFQDKALTVQKAEKAQEQQIRRIAAFCAKEIKTFWNSVEKLVEYKQNTILEEKRKKALDQQLSFIVDQTEKYSQLLAEGMNKTADQSQNAAMSSSRVVSDDEFDPDMQSEEDDEETIDQEEADVGNDGHAEEVEALQKESQMELDDLLNDNFLRDYLMNRDNIKLSGSEDSGDEDEPVESEKKSAKTSEASESVKDDEEKDSSNEEAEDENDDDGEVKVGEEEGLEMLLDDTLKEEESHNADKKDDFLNDAAAIAESIQPKGNTLSSTNVSTNIPFLLKYTLREYQHIGLDWLVTMFDRKLNGILADEMGLGKTIQTISLLAHLACEKGNWGPHLIIVPTSVMLNWEMECKKWCPAFKILTYYGTQKERKLKRIGWTKPNAFHICITSYKLVVQDHQSFRRKKWKYLILDEAQNIKNFKSQRWQLLLNFQTQQRLLLTGTPLQNNLMELWSLMHFLMPNVFQSHREFKEWFSNPVTGMIEGNSEYNENIIKRLHKVLRPFLLRRLKSEVEKQMPKKYEHVVMCRLSKRQRFLYDDYMSRAKTKETLASGNLLSVINVLMQLRKVCNHPNLFEVRPTISPFQCVGIRLHIPSIVYTALDYDPFKHIDLYSMNMLLIMQEIHLSSYQCYRMRQLKAVNTKHFLEKDIKPMCPPSKLAMRVITDKSVVPIKTEKTEHSMIRLQPPTQLKTFPPQNVKIKVSGVRFFSQQAVLKTIPVMNISQTSTGQISSDTITTSDRIATNFAQLVQTSTGKHLLLTSSPSAAGNIPVTDSPGGQKLTFLSNQAVSTLSNVPQQMTKAYVKFQLGPVASTSPANTMVTNLSTTASTSSTTVSNSIKVEEKPGGAPSRLNVGNEYVSRLYSNSNQNNLDVRWSKQDNLEQQAFEDDPNDENKIRIALMVKINKRRCSALPLYGRDFQNAIKIFAPNKTDPWVGGGINCLNALFQKEQDNTTKMLTSMLYNPERRLEQLKDISDRFIFFVPAVKTPEPELHVWHPPPSKYWGQQEDQRLIQRLFSKPATPLHHIASAMVTQFPDPRLIQYDCGKLQTLDRLLRRLKTEGHRVLIFTQMSKMLDVLEAFLNFHGYIYLRLDGTTKVDQRQVLMERFNGDSRIFAFILSTRSGGVGVNLTGADTVIFYDSDWNPTMDAQAQDRCHRIGQTKDVHIYRLVSERTIEENILKKANQKRLLGDLAIEGGNFTTAYFKTTTIQDLFTVDANEDSAANRIRGENEVTKELERVSTSELTVNTANDEKSAVSALENALAECEDAQDVQAAKIAKAEAVADLAEFDENIPLEDQDKEKEPEISKAEQEINNIIKKLSPIEKYAMKFIETTESAWSAEQLEAAAQEIENQKREWELNRLAALKEEEERRNRELEEESEMLTFSREDASNQVSYKSKRLGIRSKLFNKRKKLCNTINKAASSETLKKQKMSKINKPTKATEISIETNEKETETTLANVSNITKDDSEESQMIEESSRLSEEIENSLDSNESECSSKLNFDSNKSFLNKLDHNSPRTRSRGTVAINLWTLDVSPILPGEKPTRKLTRSENADKDDEISRTRRSSLSESDVRSDDEREKKHVLKHKNRFEEKLKPKFFESLFDDKICTVELCDILLDGDYIFPKVICYSYKDFEKSLGMLNKGDSDTRSKSAKGVDDSLKKETDAIKYNSLVNMVDVENTTNINQGKTDVTTTSNVLNHIITDQKEKTIQSKLLTESMLKEKLVREEIKKSLNVEANFNAKFHIPKKSSAWELPKVPLETSEDKLQLSDVSDGEFSISDNSNLECSKLIYNSSPKPPQNSNNRLYVTTSSYQDTFKSYIKTLHKPGIHNSNLLAHSTIGSINSSSSVLPSSSILSNNNTNVSSDSSNLMTNNFNSPMNGRYNSLLENSNVLISNLSMNTSNVSLNIPNLSMNTPNLPMNNPNLSKVSKGTLNISSVPKSSSSSLNTSNPLMNSSNVPSHSGSSSNVPRMPHKPSNQRHFSNNRFHNFSRKHGKFRKSNYTLDNWLSGSKNNRNRKKSESKCRDDEKSHRDPKNNSFS